MARALIADPRAQSVRMLRSPNVLECAIAESKLRQLMQTPLLSIVVPTFYRSEELAMAVSSLADQLVDGLEHKVEIIITDNASGPDTVAKIKHMALQYPSVSYLLHKRDEGPFFQFFAAPWRARGEYTWVFGSDDLLLPGGVAYVVDLLERERPSFLALNKKVYSRDLSQELWAAANLVPDRRFEAFEDLIAALGMNQLVFISAAIEHTETARALDPELYLQVDTRHPHLPAFVEKHHGKPSCYASAPFLVHRINPGPGRGDAYGHFFDYAVTLSLLLDDVLRQVGAPPDFFEHMNGDKQVQNYDPPAVTYVDNILENLLRSLSGGRYFTISQRRGLETILARCRPGRVQQLSEIWRMQEDLQTLETRAEEARAILDQGKQACYAASQSFGRPA